MDFVTELIKQTGENPNMYVLKVALDHDLFDAIGRGEHAGIGEAIAEKIAEKILPEMEQRIFSDPQFKERIIGDILVRIANRLADKGFLEKEPNKDETTS